MHPTPAAATVQALGHDLVAALGRPINRLAPERLAAAAPTWRAVAAWLQADRITELVVLRADRLTAANWTKLIDLRHSPTGPRLTLVSHTRSIPAPLACALDGTDHQVLTALDVLGIPVLPPPAPAHRLVEPSDEPEVRGLPRVTYPGVVNYRSHAFDQLGATEFARVDAVYRRARDATLACMDAHSAPAENQHGRESVMVWLTELVHDSPSRTHTIVRLHGAQAAFRRHGIRLSLPTPRNLLLTVTLSADLDVTADADVRVVVPRQSDGVLVRLTGRGPGQGGVIGTVTAG